MKELKDYLHLYLGCEVYDHFNDCTLQLTPKTYYGYMEHWEKPEDGQIKPILRPLSDMTEEESINLHSIIQAYSEGTFYDTLKRDAAVTAYLLSKHFDLFGLIEAGLAIDKTTVITNSQSDEDEEDIYDAVRHYRKTHSKNEKPE